MAAIDTLLEPCRDAWQSGRTLMIQGQGSKQFFGEPVRADAVLDTRTYTGIVAYEPTELVITARAGTPLAEIEAALTERGQCLAFEPPRLGHGGTLGGMVATGLSGPARASVGAARDFVLGVQIINGQAQCLTHGGQVMKNVAGYDVSRLMVGALGTLGIITQASLKVLPVAPAETTLRFEASQADALTCLQRWLTRPLPINASCWVRDDTLPQQPEHLYLRLRGARAAVESAASSLLVERPGQRLDDAATAADWQALRDQSLPFFTEPSAELALWRLSVPPTTSPLTLPASPLIEWHGGLRWLWAPVDQADALRQLATSVGGHATLFRPPTHGPMGLPQRFQPLDGAKARIHQRLRAAFDPKGIFNPGRMGPWA